MKMSEIESKSKSITVEQKLMLIHEFESGKSKKDISEEFKIGRNTLHYIFKNRDKLKNEVKDNPTVLKSKRIRDVRYPELDQRIVDEIYAIRERGEKVTGNSIKTLALTIAAEMKCKGFSGSNGWLCSFLKRHEIKLSEFNGDSSGIVEKQTTWTIHQGSMKSEILHEIIEEIIIETSCNLCGNSNGVLSDISELHLSVVSPFVEVNPERFQLCHSCESEAENILQIVNKWKKSNDLLKGIEEPKIIDENMITEDLIDDDEMIEEALDEEMMAEESVENLENEAYNVATFEADKESTSEADNTYEFKCHICHQIFLKMFELSHHTRTKHKCPPRVLCECGKFLSTAESLSTHKRKHSDEIHLFKCDTCLKGFTTQVGLSIHNKLAHKKSPKTFMCEVCGKIFKDTKNLQIHTRTHLPDEEKFCHECKICGKKVANKFSLKHHIDNIHNGIKICACILCGKEFGNKSNLRSHMFSHTREDLSCDLCDNGKVFKNRLSLQTHKQRIHNSAAVKRARGAAENFEIVFEYPNDIQS